MHIREGASSNFIFSSNTYLNVIANDGTQDYTAQQPLALGMITDNSFDISLETQTKGTIEINYKGYLKKAQETFLEDQEEGFTMLNLTVSVDGHKDEVQIRDGELQMNHNFPISFNNNTNPNAFKISGTADQLFVSYPANINIKEMPAMTESAILKGSLGAFTRMKLYEPEGTGMAFVLTKVSKNTVIKYIENEEAENVSGALIVDITHNGKTQEATILGGPGYIDNFQEVRLDDVSLKLAYGGKKIMLPFSLQLRKFELERYATQEISTPPTDFGSACPYAGSEPLRPYNYCGTGQTSRSIRGRAVSSLPKQIQDV